MLENKEPDFKLHDIFVQSLLISPLENNQNIQKRAKGKIYLFSFTR